MQYTSVRLTEHLALEEIRPSIGPPSCQPQAALPSAQIDPFCAGRLRPAPDAENDQ
jgi:hypothetical protein